MCFLGMIHVRLVLQTTLRLEIQTPIRLKPTAEQAGAINVVGARVNKERWGTNGCNIPLGENKNKQITIDGR